MRRKPIEAVRRVYKTGESPIIRSKELKINITHIMILVIFIRNPRKYS